MMARPMAGTLECRVEEACLNAWPALREVVLEGWLLRFSEGLTRRGNSANPLAPFGCPELAECQRLYRRLGLPTIFRVLSFGDPAIDQRLGSIAPAAQPVQGGQYRLNCISNQIPAAT